jgi:hypothetical protein
MRTTAHQDDRYYLRLAGQSRRAPRKRAVKKAGKRIAEDDGEGDDADDGDDGGIERAAFSISEFCVAHRISEGFYYKLRHQGLGPRETRYGDKIIISIENAALWRNA